METKKTYLWFYNVKDLPADTIETGYLLSDACEAITVSTQLNDRLGDYFRIVHLQLLSDDVIDLRSNHGKV